MRIELGSLLAELVAAVCSLSVLAGCGSSDTHASSGRKQTEAPPRVGSTRGSAVVLSRDEHIAVVANRSAAVVTILELDPEDPAGTLVAKRELDVDASSIHDSSRPSAEPWAAVIGADDDTAYVITRADQMLLRISKLRTDPRIDAAVPVGAEPTGLAISPSGARLFVANFGEGTISVVGTANFGDEQAETLSLNRTLANSGFLGSVLPRAGLAHPRALALTDDGDASDTGEVLYATEFFSQPIPGAEDPTDTTLPDRNRQGVVYPIPLGADTLVGDPITIPPLATGFSDSFPAAGGAPARSTLTTCIPNQLYAAAASGGQLFVSSMCASPQGPLGSTDAPNFKTLLHPSVFVIDTAMNQAANDRAIVLTHELDSRYTADATPNERLPLIPDDLDVGPAPDDTTTRRACLTAMGSDAVFCLSLDTRGKLVEIGEQGQRYVDLHYSPPEGHSGNRPVGIALSRAKTTPFALAINDGTQNLSVIDLGQNAVTSLVPLTQNVGRAMDLLDAPATHGRNFFSTGLTKWSFHGQAWCSCESCHPDGLSDGLTWFFARGPRRTISTAGTYTGDQRRLLLWTASVDEVHDVEGIVRTVAGGMGSMLWNYPDDFTKESYRILYASETSLPPVAKASSVRRDNLNGSIEALLDPDAMCADDTHCDRAASTDWNDIDAYIKQVRAPRRPVSDLGGDPNSGRQIFEKARCNGCHAGPAWTLSKVFYTPGEENNGVMPFTQPANLDPAMLGLLRTTSYQVPDALQALNPPALATGSAPVRANPGTDLTTLYSPATAGGDQINCALRDVGTFPGDSQATPYVGVAAPGAPVVRELRQDMSTKALGAKGFNIPSLVGVALSAPYFHAGNARTLEEAFSTTFAGHHAAFVKDLDLSDKVLADLVAYVLTIDDDTMPETTPDDTTYDLCATVSFR